MCHVAVVPPIGGSVPLCLPYEDRSPTTKKKIFCPHYSVNCLHSKKFIVREFFWNFVEICKVLVAGCLLAWSSEDHTRTNTGCSRTLEWCYGVFCDLMIWWHKNSPDSESDRRHCEECSKIFEELPGPGNLHSHLSLSHLVLHQDLTFHLRTQTTSITDKDDVITAKYGRCNRKYLTTRKGVVSNK